MNLESQIEAILYWKGEVLTIKELSKIFGKTEQEIIDALAELDLSLKNRGIRLINNGDKVALGTAPEVGKLIEALTKEEITKDLGKAGLETLSIILYRGPITRKEIDYIRGVNSAFIIRNLSIRGLVEKISDPKNLRSFLYKPTIDLFALLGIENLEKLPEYFNIKKEIEDFQNKKEPQETHLDTEGLSEELSP